jgi:membrane-associated phospholipid phosphatase
MSRRPLFLLGLAAASAAGALAVWLAAFAVPGGRALDGRALATFTGAAGSAGMPSVHGVAELADPWPFALAAAALIAIALARRRGLMAAVVPAVLLLANLTTQVLKPALADERVVEVTGGAAVYSGSWPSGHATVAMSLALCLVLVAGPRLRPLAALLGAGYAIAVGYALVALGYHLASDVLGGYLVAATFTLLGAAGLSELESRRHAAAERLPTAPLSAAVLAASATGVVILAVAALVARRPDMPLELLEHPIAALAGAAIAVLGLALTTGLARALRS